MKAGRRIAVTGRQGQLVRALLEVGPAAGFDVVAIGRPDLDLAQVDTIEPALRAAKPDAIVSAAAYTAVDKAETDPDLAYAVNVTGAGWAARAAAAIGIPIVHLSTDYVYAGDKPTPYVEEDPVGPLCVYGASKLAGEQEVAAAAANHVILRTSWVYSPFGTNFVRTMLRLASERDVVRVVADQRGNPTSALALAAGVLQVIGNLLEMPDDGALRGTFQLTNRGEATWAQFAAAIFAGSRLRGGPVARVEPITTAEYPTPARRPVQSRLDCSRIEVVHGVVLPDWQESLETCLDVLLGLPAPSRVLP
jgi:dTDP-4-dehydrorhamnose reductase